MSLRGIFREGDFRQAIEEKTKAEIPHSNLINEMRFNMKKALLGTTALIASGLFAGSVMAADIIADPVPAPVEEGFTVTVSGFANAGFYFADTDFRGDNATMVEWDSEIHFTATQTLANGIQIGARVELEGATTGDQIDEHYLWLQGNFGRLELGANDGAGSAGGPLSVAGPGYGAISGVNAPGQVGVRSGSGAPTGTSGDISGDANKISYFTPRVSGFRAGVSFTPDTSTGGGAFVTRPAAGRAVQGTKNILGAGLNFDNTFNDIRIGFGAGIQTGDAAATTQARTVWHVGALVGFGGFTIGGQYNNDNRAAAANVRSWVVSAAYTMGSWSVGAGYFHGKVSGGGNYDRIGGGVAYVLGKGVTVGASVNFEDDSVNGNGVIGGVGIATSF
jgi:hypothetical protein